MTFLPCVVEKVLDGLFQQTVSYVLCHQPKSFDWRLRGAKIHPLKRLSDALFAKVCERLNQIIRLA